MFGLSVPEKVSQAMRMVLTTRLGVALGIVSLVVGGQAQTKIVPESAAPAPKANAQAQTPYGPTLPKPLFASTDRVPKEFSIRYVYDYAQSTYTPAVPLARVPRAQWDRSTPEGALLALVSAGQLGDAEGFLSSWDEDARKAFEEQIKANKTTSAAWISDIQKGYGGNSWILVDRVEVTGYVILDIRLRDPKQGSAGAVLPTVWKLVSGKWLATNDLSKSLFLGGHMQGAAALDTKFTPEPLKKMIGGQQSQEAEAQQDFVKYHATLPGITRGAQ